MKAVKARGYDEFLVSKRQKSDEFGFDPDSLPEWLFPFQRYVTEWALRKGRSGVFVDCGLGKTPMQLVWADNVYRHTGLPVIILTPLAVSFQTSLEAQKFGYDAEVSRDGSAVAPITITNYESLEKFNSRDYGGVVCDESSALKSFDGKRRALVTEFLREHRYRLLLTATAAPNDYIELGTSSEALGYLGHMDMLSRFFTNKLKNSATGRYRGQTQEWRFKGHAEEGFWRWVSSWAKAARRPSDLGFEDEGFELPALRTREHVVKSVRQEEGRLFDVAAHTFHEEREECRRTLRERCERAAQSLSDAESGVAWCHLNDESKLLNELIEDSVQVSGSDSKEEKEEKLLAFTSGEIPFLVSKPSICGWGLNWQHINRMTYFPSHSYEQYYQAVRRMWRFGQQSEVIVDLISTEGGARILKNLKRKSDAADRMFASLVSYMTEAQTHRTADGHEKEMGVPEWLV